MPRAKRPAPPAPADAPATPAKPTRDVVFVHGETKQGDLAVVRLKDDRVELGELKSPRDGEPLHGELLRLHAREEDPRLFDCEVLADARPASTRTGNEAALGHKGPARATSDAYRENWDAIFARRPTDPSSLN